MQSGSRGRVLALFVVPLSQPDAGTAAIRVDELDAGGLRRLSQRRQRRHMRGHDPSVDSE
jgi:hypothetical protein